jgi:hypothetical protein
VSFAWDDDASDSGHAPALLQQRTLVSDSVRCPPVPF